MRAGPQNALAPTTVKPGRETGLRRELHDALDRLGAALQRCDQLEAQLRAGRQREHHHRHRAEHDDLTGLLNRAGFRARLQSALAGDAPVAVVMLDLDGFKLVNDHHGHAAGDEVLRIIAARMGHALRNGDVVSRLGGDEFACLLQNAGGPANLQALMAKLGASIASPMQVAGQRMRLRASLGLAISPNDGACVDALLTSADAAMYRAKRHRQARAATCVPVRFDSAQTPHATGLTNGSSLPGDSG